MGVSQLEIILPFKTNLQIDLFLKCCTATSPYRLKVNLHKCANLKSLADCFVMTFVSSLVQNVVIAFMF